ncbi:MAG: YbaB/EbfC family nucleoid-associated protein [Bacteroidetes bacterium]|jgi:DNA-binding YbaB/EbfC family protein|nr:YbaB/EbfC family nucleoid-associated protein [Bacteroidota bacterium]
MDQSNMADMFGKISDMQAKMKKVQDSLSELVVEAEAGGGMVKVKANGNRQVISIELDPDVIDPEDKEMVEDLVVAGVNKALEKAEESAKEKMQDVYKEILPGGGMPGMDLGKLGL